jgi:hypothetical protein
VSIDPVFSRHGLKEPQNEKVKEVFFTNLSDSNRIVKHSRTGAIKYIGRRPGLTHINPVETRLDGVTSHEEAAAFA